MPRKRKEAISVELTEMKNLGPVMRKKLNTIGIHSAEELIAIGSREAYFRMKFAYPEVCHVHLYVLQGAIDGTLFNNLPEDVKKELRSFSDSLK